MLEFNYHDIFNLEYSKMPVGMKAEVMEAYFTMVDEEVIAEAFNSSNKFTKPMVDYLELLVSSNLTEENLNYLIDTTFGNLSESVLDNIYEEFIKREAINILESYINEVSLNYVQQKAQNTIRQKEKEAKRYSRPIGLVGIEKGARAQERANQARETVDRINKIKSAAQKVAGTRRAEAKARDAVAASAVSKRNAALHHADEVAGAEANIRAEHAEKVASGEARYKSKHRTVEANKKQKAIKVVRRAKNQEEKLAANKQRNAEKVAKTGSEGPIEMDNGNQRRRNAKVQANKEKTADKLSKTGSSTPIKAEVRPEADENGQTKLNLGIKNSKKKANAEPKVEEKPKKDEPNTEETEGDKQLKLWKTKKNGEIDKRSYNNHELGKKLKTDTSKTTSTAKNEVKTPKKNNSTKANVNAALTALNKNIEKGGNEDVTKELEKKVVAANNGEGQTEELPNQPAGKRRGRPKKTETPTGKVVKITSKRGSKSKSSKDLDAVANDPNVPVDTQAKAAAQAKKQKEKEELQAKKQAEREAKKLEKQKQAEAKVQTGETPQETTEPKKEEGTSKTPEETPEEKRARILAKKELEAAEKNKKHSEELNKQREEDNKKIDKKKRDKAEGKTETPTPVNVSQDEVDAGIAKGEETTRQVLNNRLKTARAELKNAEEGSQEYNDIQNRIKEIQRQMQIYTNSPSRANESFFKAVGVLANTNLSEAALESIVETMLDARKVSNKITLNKINEWVKERYNK